MIKRIFVACGFTWNNKGDAALLMATAQALRATIPGVALSFASFTPELDSQCYQEQVVRMPLDPAGRLPKWVRKWQRFGPYLLKGLLECYLVAFRLWLLLRYLLPQEFAYRLLGRGQDTAREILNADVVVALPGGYLQATVWNDDYWLFHWLTLNMAKAAGKPILVYAQSIGPFVGRHQAWAVGLLNRVDVVSVREEFSLRRLQEFGIAADRTLLVPDAAFGLGGSGDGPRDLEQHFPELPSFPQPWCGISVREHHFPGKSDPQLWMERYLTEVALAADRLAELAGGTVFFVPQCIRSGGRDIEVSHQVVGRMRHGAQARVVDEDLSPLALQALYSRLELLIGTRMHANILTMCAGTPVVAIAYERKTNGIMQMLGQSDYVLNIEDVMDKLVPLVEKVYANRQQIRQGLSCAVPPIREQALATPQRLLNKLQGLV